MTKELDLLLPHIENRSEVTVNNTVFHIGALAGHEVIALKSGIGKVNAAVATLTLIDTFHPALVINTGVAGGTGLGAGVLDVVVADRVAYHDVWCGPGNAQGVVEGFPPFFTTAAVPLGDSIVTGGLIASGDTFVSRPDDVERITALYPEAVAVDMESGAIAQVCYMKGVPVSVIRVVSDTPGSGDNFAQYVDFWDDAPRSTFAILSTILERLQS